MNFLGRIRGKGKYGGSFENRTRFLREVVQGIRAVAPGLKIGVRVSAFDTVPYRPDPALSANGKLGPGIPEPHAELIPYRGGSSASPSEPGTKAWVHAFSSRIGRLPCKVIFALKPSTGFGLPHVAQAGKTKRNCFPWHARASIRAGA